MSIAVASIMESSRTGLKLNSIPLKFFVSLDSLYFSNYNFLKMRILVHELALWMQKDFNCIFMNTVKYVSLNGARNNCCSDMYLKTETRIVKFSFIFFSRVFTYFNFALCSPVIANPYSPLNRSISQNILSYQNCWPHQYFLPVLHLANTDSKCNSLSVLLIIFNFLFMIYDNETIINLSIISLTNESSLINRLEWQ